MFKWLLFAILALTSPAVAQNVTCATRPSSDNSNACANTAFVKQAITNANILGTNNTWTGINTFTVPPIISSLSGPLIGNGASAITAGTFSGNTTKFMTGSGSFGSGNIAKFDANGNIIDGGGSIGTVTSVGLSLPSIFTVSGSPVTGAGTLTGTFATQSANTVFSGPASGAASAPTFRSLVGADMPTGSQVLLATLTASNSPNLSDIVSFTSSYRDYIIVLQNIVPVTTATTLQLTLYSGGAFQATSYLTHSAVFNSGGSSSTSPTTFIDISSGLRVSNTANAGLSGNIRLYSPLSTTTNKQFLFDSVLRDSTISGAAIVIGGGEWSSTAAVTGARFQMSTGNILTGNIYIYGVK